MIFSRRQFLAAAAASVLPATDEAFLEDLSHRAFLFFPQKRKFDLLAYRSPVVLDQCPPTCHSGATHR